MPIEFRPEMLIPHDEMLGIPTAEFTEEEVHRTSYRPTLIIGLGGTGYDVVRKLKKRIIGHYGRERGQVFQYLVIDTAPEKPPVGQEPLGPTEFIYLQSFQAAPWLSNLRKSDPVKRWWMEPHLPTYTGNGAGAIRAVGRLALHYYASTVIQQQIYNKIRSSVEIGQQQGSSMGSVKVYIVCSVAGGTGSGQFLDIAYMVRHELSTMFQGQSYITGILVMPSAFIARRGAPIESQRWQANGYAALLELDLFNAERNFEETYGPGYTIGNRVKGQKPFDICYLISLFNENNQSLRGYDSLTEMVAEEMMLEIASPMEADVNNILDNIHETTIVRNGHPYAYSSFAVASLIYPLSGVASWCSLKFISTFVNDVLLKPIRSMEDADNEADQIIDKLNLRERGADQLINALNLDRNSKPLQEPYIDFNAFEGIPDQNLLSAFQSEAQRCQQELEKAKKEITARTEEKLLSLPAQITTEINVALKDPERGPEYIDRLTMILVSKLKAYRSEEMGVELENYNSQLKQAEIELQSTQEAIERSIGLPAVMPMRRRLISRSFNDHISTFNDRLRAEHQASLRQSAINIYNRLIEVVEHLQNQVRNLKIDLQNEAMAAEKAAQQARTRLRVVQTEFSLVKSIVDDQIIMETYERFRPNISTDEQKRLLTKGFWDFVEKRAEEKEKAWSLGDEETFEEEKGIATLIYYYLGVEFGKKLATTPLLERMKEIRKSKGSRAKEAWRAEIGERYLQAAPFCNPSIVKDVQHVQQNMRRNPNLMGYGQSDINAWSAEVNSCLRDEASPVLTKNDQELVFLKTVHGLPLFGIHEAENRLKDIYDLMQHEWRSGKLDLPLHASRVWEKRIAERRKKLQAQDEA
ncbi:MAG: tubulin-like doman-containing protein [Candidatus Hadarchaeum sp.]